MEVITRRELIRSAPERWKKQYPYDQWKGDKAEITKKLLKLKKGFNAEDVDKIIGNSSWTTLRCDVCEGSVEAAIINDINYGEYAHYICKRCMIQGIEMIDCSLL